MIFDKLKYRKQYTLPKSFNRTANVQLMHHELLLKNNYDKWLYFQPYQDPSEIEIGKDNFLFHIRSRTNDEWGYLYLDPSFYRFTDVAWKFSVIRRTKFRELAFNFRYQNFNNRYRYRFEDDRIFFDKKVKGRWKNNISSVPFFLELDRKYDVKIEMYKSLFRCSVDDVLCVENIDSDLQIGSLCIILWENDGITDALAEVGDIEVYSIKE